MKRIFALILALVMVLSISVFAGDTFNPNVNISDDGLTITVQGSSIFQLAPTLTVKCTLPQAYVTHNGQVVESSLDTAKQTITFVVADVNGGNYVIVAGDAPNEGGTGEMPPITPKPEVPVIRPVGPKAYRLQVTDGVKASHRTAKKGTWVVLHVTDPAITDLSVTDSKGEAVELTLLKDSSYGFEMPGTAITVTALYAPADPSLAFTDLDPDQWYHDAVNYVLENGLMEGMGDSLFCPEEATTRAQIVTILWRLENEPVVNDRMQFPDTAQDVWYSEAVRWAASKGIVGGYDNGCFGPDDAITREQFAAILWRYAKYKGYDVSVGEDTTILSYTDALSISEYAVPAMQWACGTYLMNGDGQALMPGSSATRVQAAALLHRFCLTY